MITISSDFFQFLTKIIGIFLETNVFWHQRAVFFSQKCQYFHQIFWSSVEKIRKLKGIEIKLKSLFLFCISTNFLLLTSKTDSSNRFQQVAVHAFRRQPAAQAQVDRPVGVRTQG
jgi:hypothetical protein